MRPTFQPAGADRASDIDSKIDRAICSFAARNSPELPGQYPCPAQDREREINVHATAVAQAGNGANHLEDRDFQLEVQNFLNARGISGGSPINLVVRADFNPNLRTAWFSAMTQVINQITLLTVILNWCRVDPRARAGHRRAPARHAGRARGNYAGEDVGQWTCHSCRRDAVIAIRGALVDRAPIAGSLLLFLLGAALYALVVAALGILLGTLATTMGQFGLLAMPVLIVTQLLSGSSTPMESMPVWLQYVMRTISPTPHFVSFAQAVLFRGADLTLVWRPLVAMLIIGSVYFVFAMSRFRRVIFGS